VSKLNRQELTDYIFKFWLDWGAFNYDERDDDEILLEIYNNLEDLKGIEKELYYVNEELMSNCWEESSLEYNNLTDIFNKISEYKEMINND
jgi:hypothetical protein